MAVAQFQFFCLYGLVMANGPNIYFILQSIASSDYYSPWGFGVLGFWHCFGTKFYLRTSHAGQMMAKCQRGRIGYEFVQRLPKRLYDLPLSVEASHAT